MLSVLPLLLLLLTAVLRALGPGPASAAAA
jgi:hypothetical protein